MEIAVSWVDALLFRGEFTPGRGVLAAEGAVVAFHPFAQNVLSLEQRLGQAGLQAGQLVAVLADRPIEHFTLLCALYRLGVASLSLPSTRQDLLPELNCDAIITDQLLGYRVVGQMPSTRIILRDDSWFKIGKDVAFSPLRPDAIPPEALGRIVIAPDGDASGAVRLSRGDIEAQIVAEGRVLANLAWNRMLCLADLTTAFGFRLAASTASQGRMISFGTAANARQLIASYKHDLLAVPASALEAAVRLQDGFYVPLHSLRGAYIGGERPPDEVMTEFQALFSNNLLFGFDTPQLGCLAYSWFNHLRGVDGAVGQVPPWIEVQITDDDGAAPPFGVEGEIRFRRERDGSSSEGGWFDFGQRGRFLTSGLLVFSDLASAAA